MLGEDCKRALSRGGGNRIEVGWSRDVFPNSKEDRTEQAWSTFNAKDSPDGSMSEKMERFKAGYEPESCPNSVLFIAASYLDSTSKEKGKTENLASGTKMGAPTKRPKPTNTLEGNKSTSEPLKPAARSIVCKLNYFQSFTTAFAALCPNAQIQLEKEGLYCNAKEGAFGEGTKAYRRRKDGLLGTKEDAAATVESFLSGARDGTAIRASALSSQQKEDGSAGTSDRQDTTQLFKGWSGLQLRSRDSIFKGLRNTPSDKGAPNESLAKLHSISMWYEKLEVASTRVVGGAFARTSFLRESQEVLFFSSAFALLETKEGSVTFSNVSSPVAGLIDMR